MLVLSYKHYTCYFLPKPIVVCDICIWNIELKWTICFYFVWCEWICFIIGTNGMWCFFCRYYGFWDEVDLDLWYAPFMHFGFLNIMKDMWNYGPLMLQCVLILTLLWVIVFCFLPYFKFWFWWYTKKTITNYLYFITRFRINEIIQSYAYKLRNGGS